jgi:quercetin dioxygenase-like cupin family protein
MKKTKKVSFQNVTIKPVFTDTRGSIFDVLEENVGHIGIITFNKGATRANHYHKKSIQYSYVLEGKLKLTISDIDGGNKKVITLTPGMITTIPAKTIHIYTALAKSKIIDMTTLGRNDNGYEKDTVRI